MTIEEELKMQPLSESGLTQLLADWSRLSPEEHRKTFLALDRHSAEELFLKIKPHEQVTLLSTLPVAERKFWIRSLPPDDAADLMQEMEAEDRAIALDLLDAPTRSEVLALMAYHEDHAGGLMNPRYVRLRPDMTVEEAIRYMRAQTRAQVETIYYAYVLAPNQKLLGIVSLRDLFTAPTDKKITDIMVTGDKMAVVAEDQHQEEIARLFASKQHQVLPVVDADGFMKGIVTLNDVVHVVQEEATEDIQKMGGMEALDAPYFNVGFLSMVKKRAGWLLALFLGEMFTATAMGYYEDEVSKAVVLALFLPLIISSGGNSGSQATTLVIRAMALGEIRLKDWWRVFFREALAGLALGFVLGAVGLARIYFWPARHTLYGDHYALIAFAVGSSLVGIVMWGTLMGAMLPFVFRRIGVDPATASAPFVATLVDVTGLIIYFTVAEVILKGTLL